MTSCTVLDYSVRRAPGRSLLDCPDHCLFVRIRQSHQNLCDRCVVNRLLCFCSCFGETYTCQLGLLQIESSGHVTSQPWCPAFCSWTLFHHLVGTYLRSPVHRGWLARNPLRLYPCQRQC